jgi:hypothetical protein
MCVHELTSSPVIANPPALEICRDHRDPFPRANLPAKNACGFFFLSFFFSLYLSLAFGAKQGLQTNAE